MSRRYHKKIPLGASLEEWHFSGHTDYFYFCAECLETEQAVNRLFAEKYEKQYIF